MQKAAGERPSDCRPGVSNRGPAAGGSLASPRQSSRRPRRARDRSSKRRPRSSEAHRMLATAAGIAGDSRKSVQHFEAALRIRPDDERSWIALANTQAEAGLLADAARTLEKAIAAIPDSGGLRWRLAGLLVRLDRSRRRAGAVHRSGATDASVGTGSGAPGSGHSRIAATGRGARRGRGRPARARRTSTTPLPIATLRACI